MQRNAFRNVHKENKKRGNTLPLVTTIKSDFDSYWFSLALNSYKYTSQSPQYAFSASNNKESMQNEMKYIEKWGCFRSRDDNKGGSLTDFDSYWSTLALNFDEWTSQFPSTSTSGDAFAVVTTTKSDI
ncbi:hypothetical protein V1477_018934 [Vespula maculifrons]|uniref:Uncharacterized protein n=1 Tax=Vespula maculifrons TaxID=7453 RepID=A0ABD2ASV6_VESMC